MEIDISTSDFDDWAVVVPQGEVDVASAPSLREALIELIGAGSVQVLIDLDSTDFIDSTGLGVLVGALRRARAAGGDVRLVCSNSRLQKVFEITGLQRAFVVADDAASAVAADAPE